MKRPSERTVEAEHCSCGQAVAADRYVGGWWRVVCWTCGRRAQFASRTRREALTLWNVQRAWEHAESKRKKRIAALVFKDTGRLSGPGNICPSTNLEVKDRYLRQKGLRRLPTKTASKRKEKGK